MKVPALVTFINLYPSGEWSLAAQAITVENKEVPVFATSPHFQKARPKKSSSIALPPRRPVGTRSASRSAIPTNAQKDSSRRYNTRNIKRSFADENEENYESFSSSEEEESEESQF